MENFTDNIIFDTVDNGIIVLDENLNITAWNRWLEIFTKKSKDEVIGKNICELFDYINKKRLQRKIKSVLVTKNPAFYSVDPHKFLIDIPLSNITNNIYSSMQQNITIVPYDIERSQVCIYIYDQTALCETNARLNMLNDELLELSHRDPLTNLFNRRYFAVQSEKIKSFLIRNEQPLSLIALDIDKFKKINDTYGHSAGDDVIIGLARILENSVRSSDVVSRFGGEEFVVLLQNIDLQGAQKIALKIKDLIESTKIETSKNKKIDFTASFGVAQFDEIIDRNSVEHLIQRADKVLYEAKKTGRNKIVLSKN